MILYLRSMNASDTPSKHLADATDMDVDSFSRLGCPSNSATIKSNA